jgi:Uma2 family endonuclease
MDTAITAPLRFASREEYRRWAEAQPRDRFEWVDGEVVAMAPEPVAHARTKARVWRALEDAIQEACVPCEALPDGITVEIGDHTAYEPDAVVNCGDTVPGEEVAARSPVIIVEVLFPSTQSVDTGRKLGDYFTLPSLHHYLIFRPEPHVIHHERDDPGPILTRIVTQGTLSLDPPKITLRLSDIYRGTTA